MTNRSKKPAVLSVGRFYCDLIFTDLPRMPTLGTEVFADGFGAHAGGGAFITAAHLAQLGHPTSLAAMLPASPFTDLMRPELEKSEVDLSLCAPLAPTDGPQITVAMAQAADRSFVTRRAGPPFPKVSSAQIAKRAIQHIHVGEVASLVAMPEIVEIAKTQGATISADCGWDDDFEPKQLEPLIRQVDLFLPNETEVEALQKLGIGTDVAPITVVKRGSLGSAAFTQEEIFTAPAFTTEVLDPTGAGDAFNAGFISSWLSGAPMQACLEAGNLRGAQSVQFTGGFTAEAQFLPELGIAGE